MTEHGRRTKVERLVETYELPADLGERLEAAWTGDGPKRKSLRELADEFSRRLLERAVESSELASMSGEVANLYRLLTADDVSSGERTEARERLERAGRRSGAIATHARTPVRI